MKRKTSAGGIGPLERVRAIVRDRSTLWLLIKRDIKVRYSDSVLGYMWSVLDPLLMSLIYWFVFTQIFDRKVGGEPYIIFLLVALLPWMWFTTGLSEGSKALQTQARLVRSTAIPREIWVLRSVFAKGIEFGFSLPVLAIFMFFYRPEFNQFIWLFLVGILLQFVLLTGVSLFLAPLVVLLKDLEPLIRIGLRFLFYASPVIYGMADVIDMLPEKLQLVYLLNPMSGIFSSYRSGFFLSEQYWPAIGMAAVISFVTLIAGWWVFAKLERTVLKEM